MEICLWVYACVVPSITVDAKSMAVLLHRGRDNMSKVGGLRVHEVGGLFVIIYIHSEYIRHRLLVFNTFFITTSNFGGAQPPLSKSGGPQAPLPRQVLCLCHSSSLIIKLSLYVDTTDFQPFSTTDRTVSADHDIAIQLFSRNDDITLEYNDTVILRFIVNPGLAGLIQLLEAAGEYIRHTATVDIIDNDRK